MTHHSESHENGVRKRKSKHHTHFNRGNRSLYHPQMPEPLLKQGKKRVPASLQRPEEGGNRWLRDNEVARVETRLLEAQRHQSQFDTAVIAHVKWAAEHLARVLKRLYDERGWPLNRCLEYIRTTGYGEDSILGHAGHVTKLAVRREWREVALLLAESKVKHLWRRA
mgnify:FL=1